MAKRHEHEHEPERRNAATATMDEPEPLIPPPSPDEPVVVQPMAAIPPIQARSTYPPGQPQLAAAPKPLGKSPTSVNQIMAPGTILGTQWLGPLQSGPMPGSQGGAVGAAQLTLCLQIDGSMGNFTLPVTFPGGSFLESISAITLASGFPGTGFEITLGTQTGLADIDAGVALPALGGVEQPALPLAQLPLWGAASPLQPFTMWLNVTGNTASAGMAIVLINYIRLTAPWSVPALNFNTP